MSGFLAEASGLLGMIQGAAGGGLPALLAQLENAGLAERVRSWVGYGDNLPVTADELARALTPEQLNGWAAEAGMAPDAMLDMLSQKLPAAVDQATPAEPPPR